MPKQFMYDGWTRKRLREQRGRAHFLLTEPFRYVTVILSPKPSEPERLFCIDSPCYHAAGPLGEGDIVQIEDLVCIRCPWHRYLVSVEGGEEVLVESEPFQPRKPIASDSYPASAIATGSGAATQGRVVTRGEVVQRTHKVYLDEATAVLTIEVEDDEVIMHNPIKSDGFAQDFNQGAMCMQIFDIKSKGLSNNAR